MSTAGNTEGRDSRGKFAKGNSGKPKGVKHKPKIDVMALIEPHVRELVERLRDAAASGDVQAAKVLLDKVVPSAKPVDRPIELTELADPSLTTQERLSRLNTAIFEGRVSLDQGAVLSRMLESQARILDLEKVQTVINLVRRGTPVKEAIRLVDARGVAALEDNERAH
jgi:hypothetical protein